MTAMELEDLRRMVLAFRMTELQVLMGFVGRPKTGKKQELMERAMALLRNPSYQLTTKIKELHSQRTQRSSHVNNSVYRPPHSALQPFNRPPEQPLPQPVHTPYHYREEENFNENISLVVLPFYDHISQILPPTVLRQTNTSNRYQEVMIPFSLSPQHAKEVTSNRSIGSGGVYASDVQVQLRFAAIENETENVKDMYPPCLVLRLNSKMVQLPNPIPTNKQNSDPKRPPRPLDLTWTCRMTPMVQNSLLICWALPNEPELPKKYCYTINLVRKRSSEYLTQNVVSRGLRLRHETEALIKAKLSDDEDDIALTSLKVSLLCPLGKMKMTLPCCPKTCDHIQCFDARLYLMMNEKKPTWNCPVCDAPAMYKDLVIDELFTEICKVAGDCDEILFSPDGSWAPLGAPTKDTQTVNSNKNGMNQPPHKPTNQQKEFATPVVQDDAEKPSNIDIIVLSDSDEDEDGLSDNSSIQPVRHSQKRPVSAISSSDSSSLELNSASSSQGGGGKLARINGATTTSHTNSVPHLNPPPQSVFNVPGLLDNKNFFCNTMPTSSSYHNGNILDSLPPTSATSAHSFTPPYPMFMPTNLDFHMPSSSFSTSHHLNSLYPMSMAAQEFGRTSSLQFQQSNAIPEPSIIDFSPRFDDSPLLDDSDIIALD